VAGRVWKFSSTAAFTKNITWAAPVGVNKSSWTVMDRRERPGLLLHPDWQTPFFLFTAVAGQLHPGQQPGASWLQSQPIRQSHPVEAAREGGHSTSSSGGGHCESDEDCNLNGVCQQQRALQGRLSGGDSSCVCDPQWDGVHCGVLALLPADPMGGYRRPGWNGWGGNPFWSEADQKYHVFTVEMTNHCSIDDYITNSQIVHAEAPSSSPGGPYRLAPMGNNMSGVRKFDQDGPAPTAAVLAKPFAHGAHAWREDGGKGALVVVIVGRDDVSYPKGVPEKRCSAGD